MRPITDRLSPTIRALVLINAALFCFYLLVKGSRLFFEEHLAASYPALLRGEAWQPFTALFVHLRPVSFFFNMLGLWFSGAQVEGALGSRRFLAIFLASGVAATLVAVLLGPATGEVPGTLVFGCSESILALFVAHGTVFNRTPTRMLGGLILEARSLAFIMVGLWLLACVVDHAMARLAGSVTAIVIAYLLAGGRGLEVRKRFGGGRAKRARRRYQVLEGGRSGSSESGRPPYLN